MEGIEHLGEAKPISHDVHIEGLTPGEVNLASAEHLIERLDAQGELARADIHEAEEMVSELKQQMEFFKEEKLAVPAKLLFAINELNRLVKNEPLSVRDLIEVKELKPQDSAVTEAQIARRELEDAANPQVP